MFIPRVDDKTLLENDLKYDAVCVDAQTIFWRKNVAPSFKQISKTLIINPATHRVQFPNTQTKNFLKLPYCIKQSEVDTLYKDADFRLQKFVDPCISFQLKHGGDIIVAPYFLSPDSHSQSFNLNHSLISDTIRNRKFKGWTQPIYAVINISTHQLDDINNVNYILGRYLDEYEGEVEGYLIIIDGFKDKEANKQTLYGLAHLVFHLSNEKVVLVNYVSGFGEVLCVAGAEGVLSGLWYGDSLALKNIDVNAEERRGPSYNRTYVPEVFGYMNDDDIKKVGYACSCSVCNGKYPVSLSDKKLHFYFRKTASINEIKKATGDDKYNLVLSTLERARKLTTDYYTNYAVGVNKQHIDKWISVLKDMKYWKPAKGEGKELSEILSEIDKANKNDSDSS